MCKIGKSSMKERRKLGVYTPQKKMGTKRPGVPKIPVTPADVAELLRGRRYPPSQTIYNLLLLRKPYIGGVETLPGALGGAENARYGVSFYSLEKKIHSWAS
jgi:hypothetical protein